METVESVLSELYQAPAHQIAYRLKAKLEDVYAELVHLEAEGVAKMVPAADQPLRREWRLV